MPRKTTTKKTTKSRVKPSTIEKTTEVKASAAQGSPTVEHKIGGTSIRVHKSTLIISIVVLLVGGLLYFGRGLIVAAVVNGQPISRIALIQEVEKQSGKQAMTGLIRNVLIEQEARKLNVVISEKEIDEQIKTVEKNLSRQGQKIDDVLAMQGMTRNDLRRIIGLDLTVTKIVEKDVKVTDKEVKDYMDENKDILPKDQKEDQLKKSIFQRLKQQKVSQKAQAWLEGLEKKAKIVKFVNY